MKTVPQKFLNYFGQNKIVCYSHPTYKNGAMIAACLNDCMVANKNGSDVYFYVNTGGTKQSQIHTVNALYVDLDAGRDKNGKYLKPSIVKAKKVAMRNRISKFPVRPNIVLDTRNGLHVYWLLEPTSEKGLWRTLQGKIYNFFKDVGADRRAQKINQIMRVSGTIWQKKWENKKEEYKVTHQLNSSVKFNIKNLAKSMSKLNGEVYSYPKSIITNPTQVSNSNYAKLSVKDEVIAFLREIATQLFYKKLAFSSNMARQLADKLEAE